MNATIQPLRQTMLHIRSKDAEQVEAGYNTHCNIDLAEAIQIDPDEECHIQIVSLEFPYAFYLVSAELNNNTIVYDTTNTLTIASGNYDVFELRDYLTTNLPNFSITYDAPTNKYTFTNTSGGSITLNWTLSTSVRLLGFEDVADQAVAGSGTTTSTYPVNLASVHALMIHSTLSSANVLSTRSGNSTTLQKVSLDENSWSIVYVSEADYRQVSITTQPVIDDFHIRIADQEGNTIQNNNQSWELSILFTIYPRQKPMLRPLRDVRSRKRLFDGGQVTLAPNLGTDRILNKPSIPITAPLPDAVIRQDNNLSQIDEADDTHPVEGRTAISKLAENTILDHLIDMVS